MASAVTPFLLAAGKEPVRAAGSDALLVIAGIGRAAGLVDQHGPLVRPAIMRFARPGHDLALDHLDRRRRAWGRFDGLAILCVGDCRGEARLDRRMIGPGGAVELFDRIFADISGEPGCGGSRPHGKAAGWDRWCTDR